MTLRMKLYAGQEYDSLLLQAVAEGHVVQVIVEDESGHVIAQFSQTDNEGSGFADLDFLSPGEDDDDNG